MAEFALGLTKTAVEGTLSLVKSAVEEEKKLRDKVQNDLVFITGEFEVMQSFLHDANREHAANDRVALTLVRQLRTLAFDVEDCVEYVVHLDLDKSSRWGWLRRVWQTVNCRAPPLPLDVAVAEIKQLKARVEDVSQRNTRYNNLILHGSNDNNRQQPAVTVVMTPAEQPPSSALAFHILRDVWEASGKWNSNMCSLEQELLIAREGEGGHDLDLRIISVWGSSGAGGGGGGGAAAAGMSSILTKAYCDPEICESFKIRIWVKLMHPFNHDEFLKNLLAQFYASSSHQAQNAGIDFCAWMKAEVIEADNHMKVNNLMQQMSEQRYLVVLEDVLAVAEWNVIKMYLPNSKNGSRILLLTPQLGIALLCTGEPFQVLELRNFSDDNQFLCAFSKQEKTPNDIGEIYCQLLQGHGVISVWGADDNEKSNHIDILYTGIINGWLEEIEGVPDKSDHVDMFYKGISKMRRKIERHSSWVDVPNPFNLKVFAQRLFLNFQSDDIRASKIREVGRKGDAGLIEWCCKFLSEEGDYHYVVVINGLQSTDDWDLIQSTFFSSKATMSKCCILAISNEESVATHCVKDHTHLAFNAKDLKADPFISALINKGCWQYAIRGKKGRLFYDRKKDAREWDTRFKDVGSINYPNEGEDEEKGFRAFGVTNVNGDYVKSVLRQAYYGALNQQQIEPCRCSWVDVPDDGDQFDLMDFCWRLLLDFYSDDPHQVKEEVAVGLMEGTIDPIEKCCWILRNEKCLVVIDDLSSRIDEVWDSIKGTFFSDEKHIQSIIIVGSALSRWDEEGFYNKTKALRLDTQLGRLIHMEYLGTLYFIQKRHPEVIQWAKRGWQHIGRDSDIYLLYHSLRDDRLVSVVWGIPGVGVSSFVKNAYYREILRSSGHGIPSHFPFVPDNNSAPTEAFAWVDVPSPFNLIEFSWRLFLNFFSDDPQIKETATISTMKKGHQVPILECRKILHTRKCLVVMDGLRSKQDWDSIKATFLTERIEGNIVVITNEKEVAMHCAENDDNQTINIRCLEANAALSLLKKISWEHVNSDQMELLKSIVGKCGGLPKVIAAICAVCRSPHIWDLQSLRDNFIGTLETDPKFHGLRSLFSWTQSYFDACSDSIKPCIFYLSIFPPDKGIRPRRLLWRWIAEGYCRDTSNGRTCEDNGAQFLNDLFKLSIIQESASNWAFCQINGFFHEYIISRPMEDNLVFALEEHCSLNSTRGGQHLAIRSSWDRRDRIVYESIDFSRLRSLTVFGKWESFFISSKNINMRLLRVLDLEDATDVTNQDLEQIAKLLTRLKFLSLRGCREITHLPSSMGGLRQLQSLDIRGTSIVTLPLFITKLQKLRYIRAGIVTSEAWEWKEGEEDKASSSAQAITTPKEVGIDTTALTLPLAAASSSVSCNNWPCTPNLVPSMLFKLCKSGSNGGDKVPTGIQKLVVLHTIGVINVNVTSSAKSLFEALKQQHLTQLHKLGVSGINKGNIKEFCEAISDHAHLTSLSVEVDKDGDLDDVSDNNILELPKTIKSLKLYGRVNKLLVWIEKIYSNLRKLKLDLTIEKPEKLQALEFSPTHVSMGHVRVRPIQGGNLHFRGKGWALARVVEIQCSSVLDIKLDDVRLYFVVLKVQFSVGSQSSLQISGLSKVEWLKEVWLKGCTDENKQYMQQQIDDMKLVRQDQKRPVLKLVQPCGSGTSSNSKPGPGQCT